jgi:hypothetical protein
MAWVIENETAGQEKYRMDRVGEHRKINTTPLRGDEYEVFEPSLPAAEFIRPRGATLEDQYGQSTQDESPEGKYPIPSAGDPQRWEQAAGRATTE